MRRSGTVLWWVTALAVAPVAVVGPALLDVGLHSWLRRLVAGRGQRARQYPVA